MKALRLTLLACLFAGLTGCVPSSSTNAKSDKTAGLSGGGGSKEVGTKTEEGTTYELQEDQPYYAHFAQGKPEDGVLKAKSRVRLVEKMGSTARVAIEGEMNLGDLTPLEGSGNFTHKTKEGAAYYTSIVQGRPPDGTFKTSSSVKVTKTAGGAAQISFEVEMGAAALAPLGGKDKEK
jgi:hypothetical protein